jgi:hypothetical protein
MGLVPVANSDGDEIQIPSTASANDVSTMRNYQRLELFVKLANWSAGVLSAEEAIYDISATIKIGALATPAPFDQLVIGGSGHYLHLTATQTLLFTTDPDAQTPILALYDGAVFQREVAYAAVPYRAIIDQSGNSVNIVSQEFMPLKPGANTITVTEPAIGTITVAMRNGTKGITDSRTRRARLSWKDSRICSRQNARSSWHASRVNHAGCVNVEFATLTILVGRIRDRFRYPAPR